VRRIVKQIYDVKDGSCDSNHDSDRETSVVDDDEVLDVDSDRFIDLADKMYKRGRWWEA